MPDLKQELADVQAAIEKIQEPAPPAVPPADPGMVSLRHPHTGDVQTVEGVPAAMIPLMVRGYVYQPTPVSPAQGEK